MRDREAIVVLGAGPTGLGAASRLWQLGAREWRLVESSTDPGGLSASVVDDHGFTWDMGGHVQFSHYKQYDRLLDDLLGQDRIWHFRRALVRMPDGFVPYPLQRNIHRLSGAVRDSILVGLDAATERRRLGAKPPSDFLAWIHAVFGPGLAEAFLVPYNLKVWGYPLDTLSTVWMDARVALPDPEQIRRAIDTMVDDSDWGGNRRFSYPLHGGTGATWKRLAARLPSDHMDFGVSVRSIEVGRRRVILSDGRAFDWDSLISTLPLDLLCGLCSDIDPRVAHASKQLVYSSCHVVGIGLRGTLPEALAGVSWMYFPSPSVPYYRVTVSSNYSPHNAPPGCWSLLAEVCETSHLPVPAGNLGAVVVAALRSEGIIGDAELRSLWVRRIERAYPTPFVGRDEILSQIMPALERNNIHSRGRFGGWKYEVSNQDNCFMQGVELVDRLAGLGQEVTYPSGAPPQSL